MTGQAQDWSARYRQVEEEVRRVDPGTMAEVAERTERTEQGEAPSDGDSAYTLLSAVPREHVAWLWPGRIPLAKLTIIDGDPDNGKSVITLDLAARVSTGTPMPGETRRRDPAGVVLVCAEDDAADTIVPRLEAVGASLDKIAIVNLPRDDHGRPVPLTLPRDLGRIEAAATAIGAALIIIDPITAFLDEFINTANDASVRRATTPLAALAQRLGTAIILVRHLNKTGDAKAIYRGSGSIAFAGAARSVLLVGEHPEQPGVRVLARVKGNLANAEIPAYTYRLVPDELYECVTVAWGEKVQLSAKQLLSGHDSRTDAPARDAAVETIREVLADGPIAAKEFDRLMREAGHAPRTIDRAREEAGVRSKPKRDGTGKLLGWELYLPEADQEASPPQNATVSGWRSGQSALRDSQSASPEPWRSGADWSDGPAAPRRIQLQRTKGWRLPPGAVSVAYPSKFQNPYRPKQHTYEAHLQAREQYRDQHLAEHPELMEAAPSELRGKILGCYCALDLPCHADVLLEIANNAAGQTR